MDLWLRGITTQYYHHMGNVDAEASHSTFPDKSKQQETSKTFLGGYSGDAVVVIVGPKAFTPMTQATLPRYLNESEPGHFHAGKESVDFPQLLHYLVY